MKHAIFIITLACLASASMLTGCTGVEPAYDGPYEGIVNETGIELTIDVEGNSIELKDGQHHITQGILYGDRFLGYEEPEIKAYTVTYITGETFTYTFEGALLQDNHSWLNYSRNWVFYEEYEGWRNTYIYTFYPADYMYVKDMNIRGIYTDAPATE